jgi:hypothetical protein
VVAVNQAIAPQTGKVKIQAIATSLTTLHRTAENRLAAPTPMIAVLIVCVALSGMPNRGASSMAVAAPCLGGEPLVRFVLLHFCSCSDQMTVRHEVAISTVILEFQEITLRSAVSTLPRHASPATAGCEALETI